MPSIGATPAEGFDRNDCGRAVQFSESASQQKLPIVRVLELHFEISTFGERRCPAHML